MFARLHPNFGIGLANFFSRKSRASTGDKDETDYGDKEMLLQFSKSILENEHFDYFIFGHRHKVIEIELNERSKYINLGDWINYYTYAVFDGNTLELKKYEG